MLGKIKGEKVIIISERYINLIGGLREIRLLESDEKEDDIELVE